MDYAKLDSLVDHFDTEMVDDLFDLLVEAKEEKFYLPAMVLGEIHMGWYSVYRNEHGTRIVVDDYMGASMWFDQYLQDEEIKYLGSSGMLLDSTLYRKHGLFPTDVPAIKNIVDIFSDFHDGFYKNVGDECIVLALTYSIKQRLNTLELTWEQINEIIAGLRVGKVLRNVEDIKLHRTGKPEYERYGSSPVHTAMGYDEHLILDILYGNKVLYLVYNALCCALIDQEVTWDDLNK